jgi:hypothetical protein
LRDNNLLIICLEANFDPELAFLLLMMTGSTPLQRRHVLYAMLLGTNILLASLVVEQARVIESQKILIKSLFFDTTQLAALKMRLHR